ncbi:antibiotic biosynthesis monooxygenase family protein [Dyadobacter sp. 3J3]|uniref:putative quinol monooxygenase n=1 Tax=Dyadobacter sp. 3J3 TaxID=2606600 RepID=UPI00286E1FFA|nr:antibiotic biosynthesis monooxygenase family protein [Dyadobacter sp. 3J3]
MIIIRIVRMTFYPEKTSEFQRIFEQSENVIRNMPGCLYLELWRDVADPNIFVTHSHWESVETLDDYRRTEFFGLVWKKTKALFADKPLAFSVEKVS